MKPTFFITCLISLMTLHGCSNAQDKSPKVLLSTEFGDMTIKLYNETPQHRDNFLKLVEEGFYDSLLFHRVINQFMIQGGDPDSRHAEAGYPLGMGGPGYTIPAEFNPAFYHKKGALAAARQGDQVNPEKESSGSQFYIVHGRPFSDDELNMMAQRAQIDIPEEHREVYRTLGGAPHLDGSYTVFGEVVEGLEVIDKIATVQADARNRPIQDIRITMKVIK